MQRLKRPAPRSRAAQLAQAGSSTCEVRYPRARHVLVVKENTWTGWYAWIDGQRTQLLGDQWLEVDAPAGKHTFEFRYLPWDVPVGLALFAAGVAISIWLWRTPAPTDVGKSTRRRKK